MITENEVVEMANRYLDGHEFVVRRSNGGFSSPCGYEVMILDDVPGKGNKFFHDDNDPQSLKSKMIVFSEDALTE
jgi:hypothetical protein